MEASWRRPLKDAEAARLARDIDQQGYAVIRNYLSEAELDQARAVAISAVDTAGGEYVCLTGPDSVAGTVLSELPQSSAFQNICKRLYEAGTGQRAPEVEFYQIFRCLQGATGQQHAYRFHYDSYVVTALLPVSIPDEGARGDLHIIPKPRAVRRGYLANVLDKVLVDNPLAQRKFLRAARRSSTISIRMKPGSLYFFWGYRSVHTNEPCDPDKLRATALFHYGDPHQDSRTRALIRRVSEHASRFRRRGRLAG